MRYPIRVLTLAAGLSSAMPAAAHEDLARPKTVPVQVAAQTPFLFLTAPENLPVWRPEDRTPPARAAQQYCYRAPSFLSIRYGPFRATGETSAELVGETNAFSPYWFARLLEDFPGLARIDLIESPGTRDDRANLELGRMIREAGIATHVPANGSVRSGAVELFLAGATRTIVDGAEFAVHSWRDREGFEARDYAPDAPQNRFYLDYYRDLGMSETQARRFYALTNSVPHDSARWLDAAQMRYWSRYRSENPAPRLAYLDVRHAFN